MDPDEALHPLVPSILVPSRWCTVFGTFPPTERAAAAALTVAITGAGVTDVAVHDASEYNELVWGEIVVLSMAPDRKTAQARADAAKTVGKGEVRGCTPLTGSMEIPKVPATVKDTSEGCVGWNPSLRSAACIVGRYDEHGGHSFMAQEIDTANNSGFDWKVGTVDPDQKPDPATVTRFVDVLRHGGYTSLTGHRARLLAPGVEVTWANPNVAVRYNRRLGKHPDFAEDEIVITCGGKTKTLLSSTVVDPVDLEPRAVSIERAATAKVHWAPMEQLLLVTWNPTWSSAGDSGREHQAALVDLGKQCKP